MRVCVRVCLYISLLARIDIELELECVAFALRTIRCRRRCLRCALLSLLRLLLLLLELINMCRYLTIKGVSEKGIGRLRLFVRQAVREGERRREREGLPRSRCKFMRTCERFIYATPALHCLQFVINLWPPWQQQLCDCDCDRDGDGDS